MNAETTLTTAGRFELWQVWDTSLRSEIACDGLPAMRRDLERELQRAEEVVESCHRSGERAACVGARVDVALARVYLGDHQGADAALHAAAEAARRHATRWGEGYAAFGQGVLASRRGEHVHGIAALEDACQAFSVCGDLRAHGHTLMRLSDATTAIGDGARARVHRLTALELFRRSRDRFGMLAALRTSDDERDDGEAMPGALLAVDALHALTPRERQVAELVGAGLTNRQIARQITVAERTVDTHVQRILTKLDCTSRVHVAVLVTTGHQPTPTAPTTPTPCIRTTGIR